MNWGTEVTKMLGIEYPIIQGAFGGFGTSALAAPVSEAGGLGLITSNALHTPDKLREDIRRAKSLTDKPFGVNLTAIGGFCIEEMREVIIAEGIRVVETAGYKADEHGKVLKEAGITWIHKVATMKHALAAQRQGADAVVLVGLEGTGFKSVVQLPTMIAIPWAASQLTIPLIAAGGIGNGRGLMAALAMGAQAVYLGTAFMATKECPIPDKYKSILVEGDPTSSNFRDRNLAPPNQAEYDKLMKEKGSTSQAEHLLKLERVLLKESADLPEGLTDGDIEIDEVMRMVPGSLAVAFIDRVVSVKDLIDGMISEAELIRRQWATGI